MNLTPLDWLTRKLERLAPLDSEDRARLANLPFRLERVLRWQDVVREGDTPAFCCLLADGFACRYKSTTDGAQQIVAFHVRGDLLDIQHLLLSLADHSVKTITDAAIGWIPKSDIIRLAWERPTIGRALWRDSLIDASIFREWVLNVGQRDAKSRIAHMLCEFVTRCSVAGLGDVESIELPLTQEQIADATGLTPVHVNRTLKSLSQEGALIGRGKRLRVLDWNRLSAIAGFDPAYLHAAA